MIFCGDVALPDCHLSLDIPDELCHKDWVVNLEGSLIEDEKSKTDIKQKKVFNNISGLRFLNKQINIRLCSLSNNHIEDSASVKDTIIKLKELGLAFVGAGVNIEEAKKTANIGNVQLLSFGWNTIKCPLATDKKGGVNPYNREHVLESVRQAIRTNNKIICLFHWGYELEAYPLPYDREFAHKLIDIGVSAVIGCHAHRVQQIEFYKGTPIVYGLGNFLFPHSVYWDGRLKFPEFTRKELAFEISEVGEYIAHWFDYDISRNHLKYLGSEKIRPNMVEFEGKAVYSMLSSKEYDTYFKRNRYHKKLLPIFKSHESPLSYTAKTTFVIMRRIFIDLLVKLNVKAKK